MKAIFVPVSGTATDAGVFGSALSLARTVPGGGHMDFYHLRLDPCESALRDPHAHFCVGAAVGATLSHFESRDRTLAGDAAHHFQDFCQRHDIPILQSPIAGTMLSAGWLEETNYPEERLLFHARHSDLTVLGRKHTMDLMPADLTAQLLRNSGRPVVIAPQNSSGEPIRTILVGWRETAECARAVAAAMPLLRQAARVVLLTIGEDMERSRRALEDLARKLSWSDIDAQVMVACKSSKSVAQQLAETAAAQHADLLVVGGYGHSELREHYLGGVSRELLQHADFPVFLVH